MHCKYKIAGNSFKHKGQFDMKSAASVVMEHSFKAC